MKEINRINARFAAENHPHIVHVSKADPLRQTSLALSAEGSPVTSVA